MLTVVFAIEYKSSSLKFSDFYELKHDYGFLDDLMSESYPKKARKEDDKKSKFQQLIDKYPIDKYHYNPYESIFNYVTGYEEFLIKKFIDEFSIRFNLVRGVVLPQYELMELLSPQNWFNLSDEVYKQKTLKLVEYAKAGQFAAIDYLSIMYYAERLNNVCDLKLDEVQADLSTGLKKAIKNNPTKKDLAFIGFKNSAPRDQTSVYYNELYNFGLKEIDLHQTSEKEEKSKSIAHLLINNFKQFEDRYLLDQDFKSYVIFNPIFCFLKESELFQFLREIENESFYFLRQLFHEKYSERNNTLDIDGFKDLIKLIDEYCKELDGQEGTRIRRYVVDDVQDALKEILMTATSIDF